MDWVTFAWNTSPVYGTFRFTALPHPTYRLKFKVAAGGFKTNPVTGRAYDPATDDVKVQMVHVVGTGMVGKNVAGLMGVDAPWSYNYILEYPDVQTEEESENLASGLLTDTASGRRAAEMGRNRMMLGP